MQNPRAKKLRNLSLALTFIWISLLIFSFLQENKIRTFSSENQQEKTDAQPRTPTFQDAIFSSSPEHTQQKIKVPMLMFHYIKDIPANSKDQLGYRLSYSPQKLEELLAFLEENKITTITYRDLKAAREGKKPLPEKSIMLTFDDGHKEHFTVVLPLLKKYNAKAVFFIITGKADQDPLFVNRSEIQALSEAGNEIWSHTVSHPNLSNLSPQQAKYEIEASKKILEEKLNIPIISFCYPAGKYNTSTLAEVKKHYLFARTTQGGSLISFNKRRTFPTIRIFPRTKLKDIEKYFSKKEKSPLEK